MLREFLASKPQERIVRAVKVFLYYLKSIRLQKFYTAKHKFDKMFQNKNIINKILVSHYIQINFRKSQKISAFFSYYFTTKLSFLKDRGKIFPRLYCKQLKSLHQLNANPKIALSDPNHSDTKSSAIFGTRLLYHIISKIPTTIDESV